MKENKPIWYTFKFALLTMVSCILILLFGLFFGNYLKNRSEKSKTVSLNTNEVVFIIDAGHGGEDAGAIADDGTLEKDLNLEIASLISGLLELNGNDVKMTRETDTLLYDYYDDLEDYTGQKKVYDLKNRLKIAEEYESPIYVGIHMNKFSQAKYSGLQVYYSKNNDQSVDIATKIKDNTKLYLQKDNKRAIKKADSSIYILNKASMPAVLIECGFLSNENELNNLKNEDYRAKLALTIFSSIID
ncbi:MAG: N-acetylmuramoyl-L-alanine amidase [Clostridia bacterium]|nr:N-acetylmuramoyl-L-alanine amidase [Clostridia bacterium]